MREFLKIVLVLSVLFATPQSAGAQGKPHLTVVGRITSADGLLTDGIKYIYRDSEGFMWFSYATGFNRWDGHGTFNLEDYLTDTNVNSSYRYCRPIVEDNTGYLYVGTLRNGLVRINRATNEFVYFTNDPEDPRSLGGDGIHDMILDGDGTIWLGTFVYGLSHFDPVTETFRNYIVDETVSYPYDCNNIRSLHKDSGGILWVGTSNGLYQFDEEKETFIPVDIPVRVPGYLQLYESMVEDTGGDMWFGTNGGILRYSRMTGKWEYIDTSNPDKPGSADDMSIVCMVEFQKRGVHQLWIGTSAGLKVYDIKNGILTHCTPKNGYPAITNAGVVQYLFIDEQDILWASLGGITLFDLNDNPFQVRHICSYPDSLYDTRATCFYEDKYGNILVGTERDGIFRYDENLHLLANYKPCAGNFEMAGHRCLNEIKEIYEDREGRLWVHTGPTGLSLFDIETGAFHFVDADVGSYLPGEIVQDSFGIHWMGAYDGLFQCSMAGEKALRLELYDNPTLPRVPVDELLSDTRGRLWLITRASGVYCLPPENRGSMTFKRYLHKDYRHRFTIEYNARSVIEDDRGDIWFRSERGLYRYDPELDSIVPDEYFNEKFKGYNFSFTRDKNGNFWLGWEEGLLCYNPADTNQSAIRVMDYRNGLPYSFITRSTMFRDSRGYLYGGGQETTRRGFFRFHPDSIPDPNTHVPNIFITRFMVKNRVFPLDSNIAFKKHIVLDHNQNFFSLEFSALNYLDPAKNKYAYRLEGLDDDWVYADTRRFANYTGVPPGNYMFRVRGSNNDGYWNEQGASISIIILKPPWKSWWAGTLYALFITLVLISITWYYFKRQQLQHALAIEQLQKEKLEEMDRMKSRFFANISHEFRTPLTLIMGPIKKLKAATRDSECIENLNIMDRNAGRLQRLIDQLLSLSRIEAGQMKLHAGEVNLIPFVNGYLQSFESAAQQKGVELIFKADKENVPIFIDRDKMEKVMYNLYSNALKFTPAGGRVAVSVGQLDSGAVGQHGRYSKEKLSNWPTVPLSNLPASCAIISITNTGPGIAPQHLPHIFDRFYQVDDSDAGFQEGTGIGLALAKELVELHHGEIRVESEVGVGTTFSIYLPLGKVHLREEEVDESRQSAPTPALPQFGGGSQGGGENWNLVRQPADGIRNPVRQPGGQGGEVLLIVEDNSDMRYYIRSVAGGYYHIIEAKDGHEGWDLALEHIPDLVISDVMMPEMDGYELCRKLKHDEHTSHIPVILLTAKAGFEDKLEGLETGADDFLIKPFEPMEMLARVKNLIHQRHMLREQFRKEFEGVSLIPEAGMTAMDAQFMEKARKVIADNLSNPEFDIVKFSKQMNMSRVQLHRKLNALINLSATAFIRTSRLNAAARLFESKAGNVAQVAYAVGFNNLSYFSRCFQKQFGMKPSEFNGRSSLS